MKRLFFLFFPLVFWSGTFKNFKEEFDFEELEENATEWEESYYENWKEDSDVAIYLYEGELPKTISAKRSSFRMVCTQIWNKKFSVKYWNLIFAIHWNGSFFCYMGISCYKLFSR